MNARSITAILLAFAFPGAGHFYLGRRSRGVAYFLIVLCMFAIGIAADGGIYTIAESRGALLRILATLGSMGSGVFYVIAHAARMFGQVTSMTFEYGTTFTLTAGLMNLLLMVDCYDIANGRKE